MSNSVAEALTLLAARIAALQSSNAVLVELVNQLTDGKADAMVNQLIADQALPDLALDELKKLHLTAAQHDQSAQ